MKFTDGFWRTKDGVEALYARAVHDLQDVDGTLVATAPTKVIAHRGDTLNLPVLTVTLSAPMPDVIRVRIENHTGGDEPLRFDVAPQQGKPEVLLDAAGGTLISGDLQARIELGPGWNLSFSAGGTPLTGGRARSVGWMSVREPDGSRTGYLHEQLELGVGGCVYGLGERFGPLVKNGQSVDIWNADGGTSSEQAYKNVPFYLTNRGYGVFVNEPGPVSFEVGSESVERVQFSVPGNSLEYFVIHGPDPKAVLDRYTALTGRPARVPAWSYGTWLSTSFTTDYDEATVTRFVDGMRERGLPLNVFHFDCFWMREFQWCDFEWDPRTFPDPRGMLARLHEKDLRICVWINPYIAQRSPRFAEAAAAGYLVRRPDGGVWQTDLWQAGMGLVDFTNPDAVGWFRGHLRRLLDQGVDCFKTDFGERIPTDVVYHDGSDPQRMHNLYAQLYNRAVFDLLEECRAPGDAVVFARSATAGGQQFPVHWGGDSTSTFASMAETLRGGLSLALSGFGFWSHDVGGFEGTPDPAVFKRWTVFGLLSSHSRFHGNESYRVPWLFDELTGQDEDDPQSAVSVTRRFATLKNRLAPYLIAAGAQAGATGVPVMRPMMLEFPDDPAVSYLDRQYLLGPDLLVAPVFSAGGEVEFYLPDGEWAHLLTGARVRGGRWLRERHGFDSVPLYLRPGAVVPLGASEDRPDTDHLAGLTLLVHPGPDPDWNRSVDIVGAHGRPVRFTVRRTAGAVVAGSDLPDGWGVQRPGGPRVAAAGGRAELS